MNVVVTGGAASGKSAYAERLSCALSKRRTYLATMSAEGAEAAARIRRHRAARAGQGFQTIACAGTIPPMRPDGVVLLDDLGNLVAQALFAPDGTMADPHKTLERLERELAQLFSQHEHVVLVANEVGAEGPSTYEGTRIWIEVMGSLACRMAHRADAVVEVVAGIPYPIKGVVIC